MVRPGPILRYCLSCWALHLGELLSRTVQSWWRTDLFLCNKKCWPQSGTEVIIQFSAAVQYCCFGFLYATSPYWNIDFLVLILAHLCVCWMDSCVLAHCFNWICCPLLELQPLDPRPILGDSRWKGLQEKQIRYLRTAWTFHSLCSGSHSLSVAVMSSLFLTWLLRPTKCDKVCKQRVC